MEGRLRLRALREVLAPPYPYELLAVLTEIALLLSARYLAGLQIPLRETFLSWLPFLSFVGWHVLGGVAVRAGLAAFRGGARRSWRFARRAFEPRRLADVLRVVVCMALVGHGYTWLKIFVPIFNQRLFDDWFYAADNLLLLGVNPNRLVLGLFTSPTVRRFFDWQYTLYFESLILGVGWYLSTVSIVERRRFAAAFATLWLASAWIYLAVPTLGPCYTFPEDYVEAHRSMPLQKGTQDALIRQYGAVRAMKTRGGSPYLNPAFGVAAMPSLHVAAQVLLAIWSRRRCRPLALAFGLMAFLTFLGSLLTGWHYAVDGYAGALLAVGAAYVGERLPVTPVWRWRRA